MDQQQLSDHICGSDIHNEVAIKIFWILYEIAILSGGIFLCYKWYIYRKTFPLMERSPYLSIYFTFNAIIYAISYPLFLQFNYLSQNFDNLWLKCIFIPFQGSYTYIYLLKSCRLSWGFCINRKGILQKYQKYINYVFKSEFRLILICLLLLTFNIVTGIIPTPELSQIDFVSTDVQSVSTKLFVARVIESYFGLFYLFVSLWIVKNVDKRVSIKYELYFILACDLVASILRPGFTLSSLKDSNICLNDNIPLLYLINWIKLFFTLVIGMIYPLRILNQQHQYFNPILLKNLDTFLSYKPEIFKYFIEYCQQQKQMLSKNNGAQQHDQSNQIPRNRTQSPFFLPHLNEQSSEHQNEQQSIRLVGFQELNSQSQHQILQSQFDSVRNQISNNSQESCSDSTFQTRERFLHSFQFEQVQAHLELFQKGMQLRQQNKEKQKYVEDFKACLLELRQAGKFQLLYPNNNQNSEIHQKICYFLQIESFGSGINRDGFNSHPQEELISSLQGHVGTLYLSQQQLQSSDENLSDEIFRKQVEPIQVVQSLMQQSKNYLLPIYNEFKTTVSFKTLKQELDQLIKAYANLQKINMAIDQNITIE